MMEKLDLPDSIPAPLGMGMDVPPDCIPWNYRATLRSDVYGYSPVAPESVNWGGIGRGIIPKVAGLS